MQVTEKNTSQASTFIRRRRRRFQPSASTVILDIVQLFDDVFDADVHFAPSRIVPNPLQHPVGGLSVPQQCPLFRRLLGDAGQSTKTVLTCRYAGRFRLSLIGYRRRGGRRRHCVFPIIAIDFIVFLHNDLNGLKSLEGVGEATSIVAYGAVTSFQSFVSRFHELGFVVGEGLVEGFRRYREWGVGRSLSGRRHL